MSPNTKKRRKSVVVFLGGFVLMLLIIAIVQQAINLTPYVGAPEKQTTLLLWALTSLNVILLLICGLILLRNLLKLYFDRRSRQPGSKVQTKLVLSFLGLSFIPVTFMSFFAYFLLHRNLDKWFSAPIDQANKNVEQIIERVRTDAISNATLTARYLANHLAVRGLLVSMNVASLEELTETVEGLDLSFLILCDNSRKPILAYHEGRMHFSGDSTLRAITESLKLTTHKNGEDRISDFVFAQLMDSRKDRQAALIEADRAAEVIMTGHVVQPGSFEAPGSLIIGERMPKDIIDLANQISPLRENYKQLSETRKVIRLNYLLWLGLITLLILFAAVWIGLYLSRRITVPIGALVEASQEISQGNLKVQVSGPAEDELGILVSSFNRMTEQLRENSQELEEKNRDLENSNQALETRRRYTEAVLETIPTGVISIAPDGSITKMNRAVQLMLSLPGGASRVEEVFKANDLEELRALIDKATRVGIAAKELPLRVQGRTLYCAITVSSLDTGDATSQGVVMVLENLTEVLKAQKANAWREVARRMAHEIKNPLTPIQLSAERIWKNFRKLGDEVDDLRPLSSRNDFEKVVQECVQTITEEVKTLKGMVDEFSRFARLPSANLVPANLNAIIENTLASYNGRLEGVTVQKNLSPTVPEVKLDPEQFKRVFVNLFDNALEAMDQSSSKRLFISSDFHSQKQTVQVVVRDSGHGISSEDREKLFLPYFSTRKRGTGLGLAIVSRIVADHKGYIHVEDNVPAGASFVIEIPAT